MIFKISSSTLGKAFRWNWNVQLKPVKLSRDSIASRAIFNLEKVVTHRVESPWFSFVPESSWEQQRQFANGHARTRTKLNRSQFARARRVKPPCASRLPVGPTTSSALGKRATRAETVWIENQLINRSLSCDAPITNAGGEHWLLRENHGSPRGDDFYEGG